MTISARPQVYKVKGRDGQKYVIYNASAIGNPPDHAADKWYYRPYPVPSVADGDGLSPPFETPEDAERAVEARPNNDSSLVWPEMLLNSLRRESAR